MKLFYYKDPLGNFGDDLNAWLWPQLLPGFLDEDESELFVGIGSILDKRIPQAPNKFVFGTGVGYGILPVLDERWVIYCVRGPLTAEALGVPPTLAVTDPAALVRTVRDPAAVKNHSVSFIPHFRTPARARDQGIDLAGLCRESDINYIDPSRDVVGVLEGIEQSEVVLCESMHGAIVADALRVPWVPVRLFDQIRELKWWDWCKSLDLEYRPLALRNGVRPAAIDITNLLQAASKMGRRTLSSNKVLDSAIMKLQERLKDLKMRRGTGKYVRGSAEFEPNPEVLSSIPWLYEMQLMLSEVAKVIPKGADFILVDENQWGGGESISGRHTIPFMERNGEYWGLPPDDEAAIRELERLRVSGASFIVFAWPCFWWLDYYSGFHEHLRSTYQVVLSNERALVFRL